MQAPVGLQEGVRAEWTSAASGRNQRPWVMDGDVSFEKAMV
jgi:hypothetical protein